MFTWICATSAKNGLNQKLPEITSFVKTYLGIDPSETPIPVAPTCHYMMGGIPTDVDGHVLADKAGTILPGLVCCWRMRMRERSWSKPFRLQLAD